MAALSHDLPINKKCFTLLPKWVSYKNIYMPKIAVTRGRQLIRTQCKFFVVHWFDVGFVESKISDTNDGIWKKKWQCKLEGDTWKSINNYVNN